MATAPPTTGAPTTKMATAPPTTGAPTTSKPDEPKEDEPKEDEKPGIPKPDEPKPKEAPQTCDHFSDGATVAYVGKPVCVRTEAAPLKPLGKRVKVCRPATLPEAIDPLAITSATVRSTALHLTRTGVPPCPSDMTLEIASHKAAPLKACDCDEYDEALIAGLPGAYPTDEASLIRALPDTLCMKTHSEIIPAAGYRASRKTICQAVGAGYPRIGVEDGGALTWLGCRADAVPCVNKETK